MSKRIIYTPGEIIGTSGVVFLKDVVDEDKHRKALFLCPNCKREWISRIDSVKSNKTTNCGCVRKEKTRNLKFSNLKGKRFGYLTVIEETNKRSSDGTIFWKCQCDCGNITLAKTNHLKQNRVTSCGCRTQSVPAEKIENILFLQNIIFEKEKYFIGCDNPLTKGKLRFDFYLPDYNCCIEYDGEQHFKENTFFRDSLSTIQYRDKIKNQYCINNNIKLIRIPYWDKEQITWEYILNKMEGICQ